MPDTPRTITPEARLQIIGLLTLAKHHSAQLEDIRATIDELFQHEDDSSRFEDHISDFVYTPENGAEADVLIERLGFTVMAAATQCEICAQTLQPVNTFKMNGHVFCTKKECIEKGIKKALDPMLDAMEAAAEEEQVND